MNSNEDKFGLNTGGYVIIGISMLLTSVIVSGLNEADEERRRKIEKERRRDKIFEKLEKALFPNNPPVKEGKIYVREQDGGFKEYPYQEECPSYDKYHPCHNVYPSP